MAIFVTTWMESDAENLIAETSAEAGGHDLDVSMFRPSQAVRVGARGARRLPSTT